MFNMAKLSKHVHFRYGSEARWSGRASASYHSTNTVTWMLQNKDKENQTDTKIKNFMLRGFKERRTSFPFYCQLYDMNICWCPWRAKQESAKKYIWSRPTFWDNWGQSEGTGYKLQIFSIYLWKSHNLRKLSKIKTMGDIERVSGVEFDKINFQTYFSVLKLKFTAYT